VKNFRALLCAVGLSVTVVGCMGNGPDSQGQDGQEQDVIHFLREKPSDAPDMLALLEGELELNEGCLSIRATDIGTSHTAIWPFEFDFIVQEGNVKILNGDTEVVAQVGDRVRVSGGELPTMSREVFEENFIGAFECLGPYWLINHDAAVVAP
jgi:hypothetical protein